MSMRLSLIFMCLFFAVLPAQAKRVALVIGNSNYKTFNVLPNPVNDAKLMETALRESGFEVTLILDADQAQMKRTMLEFGRTLRKGVDASVFFYAGHGVQVKGENYLIPTDADLESEDEVGVQTVDVNAFLETMESAKSPFNIIVLDACRNNPLSAHRGGGGGLAPVTAPKGSFVAYSTAPGKVALDGDGLVDSPYTLALAKTLSVPGLKLEDVFKKTRELVLASTSGEQVPFESTSITGDFYFKDAPVVEQSVIATPVVPSADPIAADFDLARTLNSTSGWDLFLSRHSTASDMRVDLAKQEREKLALLLPANPTDPAPAVPVAECLGVQATVQGQSKCLTPQQVFTDCEACPEMVVVPAGGFVMGSPAKEKDRKSDEGPQHQVTFNAPLAVGKFEVTYRQFNEFVKDTHYNGVKSCWSWVGTDWKDTAGRSYLDTGFAQTDFHPVACVNWPDAQAYLTWLSKKTNAHYRLLTEAEWEYAARAGTSSVFPSRNSLTPKQANFNNKKKATMAVGSFSANAFGLFDMAGNVWEWTEDCYEDSYKNADPSGKATNGGNCDRVVRGGGWSNNQAQQLRSACRAFGTATDRADLVGFRVARTF
jgi:formylglycine-generating enzyme required for sulfatase activity